MELGNLDNHEVTRSSACVCVTIEGLKPLIKSSVLEFDSGEESTITMEYEKLGNHCSICNRLSHLCFQFPDRLLEVPAASIDPPYGSIQSAADHATRERPTHNTTSQRDDRLPEFQQRLDRHGNPFGERVSVSLIGVRGPRNKITPSTGRNEHDRKRSSDY